MTVYCDLHVHLGQSLGKKVKITASKNLNLDNLIYYCRNKKGLNIAGIVDGASTAVMQDLTGRVREGSLQEKPGGGLYHVSGLLLIIGSEIEIIVDGKPIHLIIYFPYLENVHEFSRYLSKKFKNPDLGTQVLHADQDELFKTVRDLEGEVVPAHAFTPFKGIYGNIDSLQEAFGSWDSMISLLELGLSADSSLANNLQELKNRKFIACSDAHSLASLGREHMVVEIDTLDYSTLFTVLKGENSSEVMSLWGLDPRLGKYYRTTCRSCGFQPEEYDCLQNCPQCGGGAVICGVLDRLMLIKSQEKQKLIRPEYFHYVPLNMIPGIGPRSLEKILKLWQTEMKVLHEVDVCEIMNKLPEDMAMKILASRKGTLNIMPGGAGKYGRILGLE